MSFDLIIKYVHSEVHPAVDVVCGHDRVKIEAWGLYREQLLVSVFSRGVIEKVYTIVGEFDKLTKIGALRIAVEYSYGLGCANRKINY